MTNANFDFRAQLAPVRDQGTRPTCLAFATSDGHAFSERTSELSVDYLHYHAARRLGVGMNTAVTPDAMTAALLEDGQPLEALCPYDHARADTWTPAGPLSPAWRTGTTRPGGVASSVLSKALSDGKAPVLGLAITPAFYDPDPATARIADDRGPQVVGHAMLVVGMAAAGSSAEFLVRNSWGPTWGAAGYAWIPAAYVDRNAVVIIEFEGGRS